MPLYGYVTQGYWADIGNLDQYRLAHQDVFAGKVDVSIPGLPPNRVGKNVGQENSTIDPPPSWGTVVVGRN